MGDASFKDVTLLRGQSLSEAEATFYVTQRDLMRARYQAVVTLLNLKADVATLSTEDISQISSMLC